MHSMLQTTGLAIGLLLSVASHAGTVLAATNSERAGVEYVLGDAGLPTNIEDMWPLCKPTPTSGDIAFCQTPRGHSRIGSR